MNAQRLMTMLGEFPTILGSSILEAKSYSINEVEAISDFGYNAVLNDGYLTFDKRGNKADMVVKYIHLDHYLASRINNALFEQTGGRIKLADLAVAAIERLNPMVCSYKAVTDEIKSMVAV